MSTRRKEQKLKSIAKLYLNLLITKETKKNTINNNRIDSFRSAVELAYSSLSAPLQKIINNDFFYQDYPGWWRLIYKKNNYHKLKNAAISSFLEAFYEI